MSTPDTPDIRPTRAELAAQLSKELIQLRDALVTLSISLKDWQFEIDHNGRRASQEIADQALEKFRRAPSPGTGDGSAFRSSAPEGS